MPYPAATLCGIWQRLALLSRKAVLDCDLYKWLRLESGSSAWRAERTIMMPTEWLQTGDGVRRRIVADGERIMLAEVHFQAGAAGSRHNHPHEQATFVIKGRIRFTLGDKTTEYVTGDTIH